MVVFPCIPGDCIGLFFQISIFTSILIPFSTKADLLNLMMYETSWKFCDSVKFREPIYTTPKLRKRVGVGVTKSRAS